MKRWLSLSFRKRHTASAFRRLVKRAADLLIPYALFFTRKLAVQAAKRVGKSARKAAREDW